MRLLDLFCCAGGAAEGYHRAGFDEIVGIDLKAQPRYPFEFFQTDAIDALKMGGVGHWNMEDFDAIHASPPCQHYSVASKSWNGRRDDHPDLVAMTRWLLMATGKPYIIENVVGAPLVNPVILCGTMFPKLRVIRHRLFESNIALKVPEHPKGKHPLVYTLDKRKAHYGKLNEMTDYVSVNGGGNCSREAARDAMGIPWMTKTELNEAIPPDYTELLGRQLIAHIDERRIAA
jgi:DNA (cytosine-5)-methyltransferase 1